MSTLTFKPTEVSIAPRQPRPTIVLGEESIIAPKTGFEITLADDDRAKARLIHAQYGEAHGETERLLQSAAGYSVRRAESHPSSSLAWSQAGFAQVAAGRSEEAILSFERALGIDPKMRSARIGIARAHFESGRPDVAVSALRSLLGENSSDGDVAVSLAVVLTDTNRDEEALLLLESVPPAAAKGPAVLAVRGSLQLARGKYAAAIADLRIAVRSKPDWVHARNALGLAHLKNRNTKAAEREFREAVRTAPNYQPAFLNLLRVMAQQDRHDEVLEACAYRFSPSAAPAAVGAIAGGAALYLEKWRTALGWLESALEKVSDERRRSRILNDIGCAYSRLGNQGAAGSRFEESVSTQPSELSLVNRAKVFLLQDQPMAAVAWLKSTQDLLTPPSYRRQITLAQSLVGAGFAEEAVDVASKLQNHSEADADVFILLGAVFSDYLGDYASAIEACEAGLARFPDEPILVNNCAYAYLMAGRVPEAKELLVREFEPDAIHDMLLTATRGLLALKEGDIARGKRLYEEALGFAGTEEKRERVRAKRDLEVARALLNHKGKAREAVALLERASKASIAARPYQQHAAEELRRLAPPAPNS